MTIGNNNPYMGLDSIIGVAEETTFGTFVTATTNLEFISEGFKQEREEKKIETINSTRHIKRRLQGNETVSGNIETYLNVASDPICLFFKHAMGGTVSSLTQTVASNLLHIFNSGNTENNDSSVSAADTKSLSVAVRRGNVTTWNHSGCKINTLTIKGEVGNPVTVAVDFLARGCSTGATLPSVALSSIPPLNFTDVVVGVGITISAVTTEYFTSFEFSLNNNIVGDTTRNLGSRNVYALPVQRQEVTLKLTQNFDTTTSYDRFIQNTACAIQITIDSGITMTAGGTTYAMIINIPEAYCNSNNPVVGDTGVLKNEATFTAIYSSAASYYVQLQVRNSTAGY